jgi:diguanylate cyclase (GGDEF)-like protein
LKRQTQDSEALTKQRQDMESVLAATRELSASVKQTEVMSMLIQQMVTLVGAFRCSMSHVDEAGRHGTILISREILAAGENFGSRTLSISLDNYPEVRRALETRNTVLVNDVPGEPMMAPAADVLKQIGIKYLLVVPVTVEDPILGTLMLCLARRNQPFVESEVRICELVAEVAAGALKNAYMHESLESKNVSLKKLAVSDPLTGLYNRRFFDMRLSEECRLATRHGLPLSMIMLDVDFFKRINDAYGHQVGDRVLVELARVVLGNLRQTDCMARFGGEEFVVLLPLTDLGGGIAKAEEIRLAVKEMSVDLGDGEVLRITTSCGVSELDPIHCSDPDALLAGADHAVYEAKGGGRNKVCGYAPDAVAAAEAAKMALRG